MDIDKYNELNNYATKKLSKISIYITNRTNTIISNHENVLNKLKDQYLYLSLIKDNLYYFVLNYYLNLNNIISIKSISYSQKEKYDEKIDKTLLKKDMEWNSE